MAGLAAMIGVRDLTAATAALAVRGPETAGWRVGGIQLTVCAAMPAVHEAERCALVIDGDAAPSVILTGYAQRGPAGLLPSGPVGGRSPDPYAVILADPDRDALLLARYGDGPPLYWARPGRGAAMLAASEPVALLAAGLPAEPDPETVARFLATGACDDTAATFFAGIQRVLPGQVVEIRRGPGAAGFRVQVYAGAGPLRPAPVTGRIGVRLGQGAAGLAVLEQVLRAPGSPRPLPVYSAAFPELAATGWSSDSGGGAGHGHGHHGHGHHGHGAAPTLGELGRSAAVRHRALPFFADEIDVDAYLTDLGEPTPYLDDWLLWAVARRVAGEVDTLVDAAVDAAGGAHRSRLADRIGARFGLVVAPPTRGPVGSVQPTALVADLLRRMRVELVTTFLAPRYGEGTHSGLAAFIGLLNGAGDRVDPAGLWRRYLLERWLRCVVAPAVASVTPPQPARQPRPAGAARTAGAAQAARAARAAGPVVVAGRRWLRHPVRAEALAAGDKLPEKLAWYASEGYASQRPEASQEPWYVLLAAKPVAVMQGRARSLWEIEPRLGARLLHRLAVRSDPDRRRPAGPFVTQVMIEECGWWRALAVTTAAGLGRVLPGSGRSPAGAAIRGPREDAVPPGHVSVIPAPVMPDLVAADVVAALRTALPEAAYAALAGCAVVSTAGDLLGWAARASSATAPARDLYADDPFGDDHTPVVLAISATDGGQ